MTAEGRDRTGELRGLAGIVVIRGRIVGLGPLFSGDYYLAEVTHRFDTEQGMRSDLTVERPGLGRPS